MLFIVLWLGFSHQTVAATHFKGALEQLHQRMNRHAQCSHAPVAGSQPELKLADICEDVAKFPRKPEKYSFTNSKVQPVCKGYYPNGVEWRGSKMKAALSTRYSAQFKLPTRAQYLRENGMRMVTKKEAEYLYGVVDKAREQILGTCCGKDKACAEAMNHVPIRICSNPQADANPETPDQCLFSMASYEISTAAANQIFYNLNNVIRNARHLNREDREFGAQTMDSYYSAGLASAKDVSTVMIGEIVLPPYMDRSNHFAVTAHTLSHELSHACSDVKRQIAAYRGDFNALDALYWRGNSSEKERCKVRDKATKAYESLLKGVPGAKGVSKCLVTVAKQAANKKSAAYIENACPSSHLEEGFAQVLSIYAASSSPDNLPYLCGNLPSNNHPATNDVLECMFQNIPDYRDHILQKLCVAPEVSQ